MTDEMTIDVPLLRKALDWAHEQWQRSLRGEPSEWSQGIWIAQAPECGTVCCIAGKVSLETGWRPIPSIWDGWVRNEQGREEHASDVARAALGLTIYQASFLYGGSNTVADLYHFAEVWTGGEITPPPGIGEPSERVRRAAQWALQPENRD